MSEDASPTLQKAIISFRVLSYRPDSNSFMARICVRTKQIKESLLDHGRLYLGNRAHRTIYVNIDKEVRRCLKCQKYGHTKKFCRVINEVCGRCGAGHESISCLTGTDNRCVNCSEAHQAGSISCPAPSRL